MQKTPDEIKKGLVSCISVGKCWTECPYFAGEALPFTCIRALSADALAYIKHLETRYDEVFRLCGDLHHDMLEQRERGDRFEAERNVLLEGMKQAMGCRACKHYDDDAEYVGNKCMDCSKYCNWEWRGVQKED